MRFISTPCALLSASALLGCVASDPATSTTTADITTPDSNTAPPSVVRVNINHGSTTTDCTGVIVDAHWVITAAHCFEEAALSDALMVNTVSVASANVHFHPLAWPDGEEVWQTVRPGEHTVAPAHDLAMIAIGAVLPGQVPALLWHPANPQVSIAGRRLTVAGYGTTATTGHETANGLVASPQGSGQMLSADRHPSGIEQGDSGGPALVTLANGLPASVPFNTVCPPTPGGANAQVLVGINQSIAAGNASDLFVPTFQPVNLDWIVGFLGDSDHDGVCDDVDNCPSVPNNQDNCNALAEAHGDAWDTSTRAIGDACDPNPCPVPSLVQTSFVPVSTSTASNGYDIIIATSGRSISDELDLKPVLGDGSNTSSAQTQFCLCRNSDGTPITDPAICAEAPFYCTLDPRNAGNTEIGSGTPDATQTYWHQITTAPGGLAAWLPLAFPGPNARAATWDYVTDYTRWVAAGWMPALATDPRFGAVRDLVGTLWSKSSAVVDNYAHGYPPADHCYMPFPPPGYDPVCSITDVFTYGTGPERRLTTTQSHHLAQYRPAFPWSYCASCNDKYRFAGEELSNPAPFLTLDPATRTVTAWTSLGGVLANDAVAPALFDSLVDTTKRWVPASEPIAIANRPGTARAMMLTADGTRIVGALTKGPNGFGLLPRSFVSDMVPRVGYGAAYSRTADAVFVAGGRTPSGVTLAEVWTFHGDFGTWTSASIDGRHVPVNVQASVFSHKDLRMWLVSQPVAGERHLVRIDPATGTVDTDLRLPAAEVLAVPYLTLLENGRVVLAGTNPSTGEVIVSLLGANAAGGISIIGQYRTPGALAMAPTVAHSAISLPLAITTSSEEHIAGQLVQLAQFH